MLEAWFIGRNSLSKKVVIYGAVRVHTGVSPSLTSTTSPPNTTTLHHPLILISPIPHPPLRHRQLPKPRRNRLCPDITPPRLHPRAHPRHHQWGDNSKPEPQHTHRTNHRTGRFIYLYFPPPTQPAHATPPPGIKSVSHTISGSISGNPPRRHAVVLHVPHTPPKPYYSRPPSNNLSFPPPRILRIPAAKNSLQNLAHVTKSRLPTIRAPAQLMTQTRNPITLHFPTSWVVNKCRVQKEEECVVVPQLA